MQYILHLFLGFVMAFIGVIAPGMLNMTAVRVKIEKNKKSALLFALGAAIIVIPQAYIALAFAKFFTKHPEIIERLKMAGVFVLLTLSVFFFFQARKKIKAEGTKKRGNYFFIGMTLSSINMLAIPYYLLFSSVFEKKGWLIMSQPYISVFVAGAFLGTLFLFLMYIEFASIIERKVQFIARNINYILSVLFFVLGILLLTSFFK